MSELLQSLGIQWPVLIAQIINFAILLLVLSKFVYKPVIKLLDERRRDALKAIEKEEESAKKLIEAERAVQKILAEGRSESTRIIENSRKEGEMLKQKLILSAKDEIAKLKADAEKSAKDAEARLISDLRNEVGTLIIDTVEKAFSDILDAKTQGKMVEQALSAIRHPDGKTNSK